jgi:hypothetical protein
MEAYTVHKDLEAMMRMEAHLVHTGLKTYTVHMDLEAMMLTRVIRVMEAYSSSVAGLSGQV